MRKLFFLFCIPFAFAFTCSNNENPPIDKDSSSYQVFLEKEKSIDEENLVIKYITIEAESRCPQDMVCVHEGNIIVKLSATEIDNSANTQEFFLELGDQRTATYTDTAIILGKRIKLIEAKPIPCTTCKFGKDAYFVTLTIDKA